MIKATRKYTAQDIIELFNGDQAHIYKVIADALNSGSDVGKDIKSEIKLMEASAEDAAELLHIEMFGTEDDQIKYSRTYSGLNAR